MSDREPMTDEALEALKANGYQAIRQAGVDAMNALATLVPDGLRAGVAYLDEKRDGAPSQDVRVAMELDRMRLETLLEICELRDRYSEAGNRKVEAHQRLATPSPGFPGNGQGPENDRARKRGITGR